MNDSLKILVLRHAISVFSVVLIFISANYADASGGDARKFNEHSEVGKLQSKSTAPLDTSLDTPSAMSQNGNIDLITSQNEIAGLNSLSLASVLMMNAEARTGGIFDIYFTADRTDIAKGADLITRTTFYPLSASPVTVSLVFAVTNSSGEEVYSSNATTTITNPIAYAKRYSNLTLPDGKYRVHMHLKYADNIGYDFTIPFTVDSAISSTTGALYPILEIAFLFFPVSFALYFGVIDQRKVQKREGEVLRIIKLANFKK